MEQPLTPFNDLWEREALAGLGRRLRSGYPQWQRRRRRRRLALAAAAAVAVAGITIFNFQLSIPRPYDSVACNRAGIPDRHWADVAAHVLTAKTL